MEVELELNLVELCASVNQRFTAFFGTLKNENKCSWNFAGLIINDLRVFLEL
jgi:hypothetical protein